MQTLLATTFEGLEPILASEITALGYEVQQTFNRAVSFNGNLAEMYRANYWLRTALRILMPIDSFRANSERGLYYGIYDYDWSQWLNPDTTFAIETVVKSPYFSHSHYVALKAKDAIVDQFRAKTGTRPSIARERPNLRIRIHIFHDEVRVLLDSSDEPLNRRGYRIEAGEAPLNEILAAGMLHLSGWVEQAHLPLVDPMCGSGTIPIEAAMIANGIAPQHTRDWFGCMNWPNFDQNLWEQRYTAPSNIILAPTSPAIVASDIDSYTLSVAKNNADRAGVENYIDFTCCDFENTPLPQAPGFLITNPPYGQRLGEFDETAPLYERLGSWLKHKATDYNAWVISSNKIALRKIGLHPNKKLTLFNGPLECGFWGFELYEGSI